MRKQTVDTSQALDELRKAMREISEGHVRAECAVQIALAQRADAACEQARASGIGNAAIREVLDGEVTYINAAIGAVLCQWQRKRKLH
ncbi:hypothetical protein FGK63_01885 [Ruegeria sediminis]|uniref:Chorismate mutase n=1 Tax=Ruegeria sediminis TaxID=2583820 RepID=A0ABY2X393_9RHOB|nr:hypothetical protein [Ruegeria sediminis]TMV09845.1 hypothetical protein FGK63_01885 [Ruegeria sediminis]